MIRLKRLQLSLVLPIMRIMPVAVMAVAMTAGVILLPGRANAQTFDEIPPAGACGVDDRNRPIQVEINLNCQRLKILNPNSPEAQSCQLYFCPGSFVGRSPTIDVTIFNVNIRLDSEQAIGQVLFLLFSLFLGIVVLAMVVLGIYGAYRRAQAESSEDVATSQKILTNAVIGFLIVGLSLLIIQVFASFIGLGSINEMVDFGPALE